MQRAGPEPFSGLLGLLSGLGVEQVGRGDVGQGLRRSHVLRVERAGGVAVEVQRTEPTVVVAQREREHSGQPGIGGEGAEVREAPVTADQVRQADRLAGLVGRHARPLAGGRLHLLELQGRVVGRRDVVRVDAGGDEGDAGGGDRQHVHDASDEVVQDPLDREVGHQGARELAQHTRQLPLLDHARPPTRTGSRGPDRATAGPAKHTVTAVGSCPGRRCDEVVGDRPRAAAQPSRRTARRRSVRCRPYDGSARPP